MKALKEELQSVEGQLVSVTDENSELSELKKRLVLNEQVITKEVSKNKAKYNLKFRRE